MTTSVERPPRPGPLAPRKLAPRILLVPHGGDLDSAQRHAPDALVFLAGEHEAFGDGSHPTTRLCARAVDLICRQRSPARVIDVGCGTAILARVARAHGATTLVATDIDDQALISAKENIALDGARRADAHGLGAELPPIVVSNALPSAFGHPFDLVVANILQGPLLSLAPAIAQAAAPDADVLLSGFTRPQLPTLKVAYEAEGLSFVSEARDGDWIVAHFRAP